MKHLFRLDTELVVLLVATSTFGSIHLQFTSSALFTLSLCCYAEFYADNILDK